MRMNVFKDKLYWSLLIPGVLFSLFLFFILPQEKQIFVLIVPVGFWMGYYAMRYMEKRRKKEKELNYLNQMPSE